MKKVYFIVLIFIIIILATHVCYGFQGKHINIEIPESVKILADNSDSDEKDDVIVLYLNKDPSTEIEITETKPDLNPISTFNYFKDLENQVKNPEVNAQNIKMVNEQNKTNANMPNIISREIVNINNRHAVKIKMKFKNNLKYGVTYIGRSFFRVFEITVVTKDEKFLDSNELNQILDSLNIKEDIFDYFLFGLAIVTIIVITIFVIFGIIKLIKHLKKKDRQHIR